MEKISHQHILVGFLKTIKGYRNGRKQSIVIVNRGIIVIEEKTKTTVDNVKENEAEKNEENPATID